MSKENWGMSKSKKIIVKNEIATDGSTTPGLTGNETESTVQDEISQDPTLPSSSSGTTVQRSEEESLWTETVLNGEISNSLHPPVSPPSFSPMKNNGTIENASIYLTQ